MNNGSSENLGDVKLVLVQGRIFCSPAALRQDSRGQNPDPGEVQRSRLSLIQLEVIDAALSLT